MVLDGSTFGQSLTDRSMLQSHAEVRRGVIEAEVGRMKIRSFIAVALLSVPILLVLLWNLCNRALPAGDGADFAEASLRIASQFHE